MKTLTNLILVLAAALLLFAAASSVRAQTLQDFFSSATGTNAAVDFEALRGMTGNKYIFAGTYVYGMTTNAALLISYDQGYTSQNVPDAHCTSLLKGGLSWKTSFTPLATWFGNTNFVVKVGVYEEAGVETSGPNNGDAVNVAGGFADTGFHIYKAVYFHVGGLYQNRTQQGTFGGNYLGLRAGVGGSF